MRKPVMVLLAIALAVILGIWVGPSLVDVNRYRGRIQAELEKALGRPVAFDQIRASLTPPSVQLDNVTIGEDPQFGPGPFATAETVTVALNPWALIRKTLDIRSLRLANPHVELIGNSAGVWNFSSLGQPRATEQKKGRQFQLADLRISNGLVRLTDQQRGLSATYDNIDLTLKDFAPGKPFEIAAVLHLPGTGSEKLEVSGQAGPLPQSANNGSTPFTGRVTLTQVSLADLRQLVNVPVLQGTEGIASGSLDLRSENGAIISSGSLKLDQARIRGLDLGYPVSLDYKLGENLTTGTLEIESGTLRLGSTPLSIAGTIETKRTPMQVEVRVSTSNASIAEAARLASVFGVAFHPDTKVTGKFDADIHAQGPVPKPELSGKLAARGLTISGGMVKEPLQAPNLELALSPSAIRSSSFIARAGGTTLNAQFTLTNYTGDSPGVQASLRTVNADLKALLSIARAYGAGGAGGIAGSGTLTLNMTASGPLSNASAMTFTGAGQLQNASLSVPSLTRPLHVRNANIRFDKNAVALENLSASLDQTSATGAMTVRNFAAPQAQFTLAADKVDLVSLQQLFVDPRSQKQAANPGLPFAPSASAAAAPNPSGPLDHVTGSGTVKIGTLTYDQLVLSNVRSQVSLDRGIVRLAPFAANLYEGQETGQIVLDTRVRPMAVDVSGKLQRVDANQLVSSVSNLKETIYGLLAANANARFQARSAADIARTLSGTVSLDLTNGRIAPMDILNELASIGRFAAGVPARKFHTDVVKLTGSFDATNGVARTNNLKAEIPGATLAFDGSVNLATDALDLRLTAVLSREFSQRVGGTQIGGFLETALANNKGELVLPVLVTGSFHNPRFAPDFEQLARMQLQNLLPSFKNPGQWTTGILGPVPGGPPAGAPLGLGGILAQQPSPQPPQNPLDQFLNDLLRGRKKKSQQPQQPPQQP